MATKRQSQKIKDSLRKIKRLLAESRKKDLNETETANRVERFLEVVLGYDLFKEISAEQAVGSRVADYLIRIKGKPAFIIEVKRIKSRLKDNHVYQVKNYAANLGIPWCVLTNGYIFRLYKISFSESLNHDLVFETNVLDDDLGSVSEKLCYLARSNFARKELEALWRKKKSLSKGGILEAVMSLGVLRAIRKEVRKASGETITEDDIARALKRMLSEELYSEYEELTEKVKRQKRRKARMKKKATNKKGVPQTAASPTLRGLPA